MVMNLMHTYTYYEYEMILFFILQYLLYLSLNDCRVDCCIVIGELDIFRSNSRYMCPKICHAVRYLYKGVQYNLIIPPCNTHMFKSRLFPSACLRTMTCQAIYIVKDKSSLIDSRQYLRFFLLPSSIQITSISSQIILFRILLYHLRLIPYDRVRYSSYI